MAKKKFKSDVQLEGAVSLPNKTAQRALALDSSGNIVESLTTEAELALLSGTTSNVQTQLDDKIPDSEKGAANGVATLDAGSKIPSSQLPAIAITEVFVAADITARDALTIGTGDGEVQEGDVVRVTDASADAAITSGAASYIYDGAAYVLLKAGDEVLSVNGETGIVSLDAGDIGYVNTTSGLTATDTQSAIDEVEGRLDTAESDISDNATGISDHLSDAVDAHDASAISYVNTTSSLAATEVQAAIDEVEGRLDTVETNTGNKPDLTATTDNRLVRTLGATDLEESGITVSDTDDLTGVASLEVSDIKLDSSGLSSISGSSIDYIIPGSSASQYLLDPSNLATLSSSTARAQGFAATDSGELSSIEISMYMLSTYSGPVVIDLYDDTGTSGSPGSIIATSNSIDAGSLPINSPQQIVNFTFPAGTSLTSASVYYIVLNLSGASGAAARWFGTGSPFVPGFDHYTSSDGGSTWTTLGNQTAYHNVKLNASAIAHKFSPSIAIAESIDASTTGANQILELTTGHMRLTNASLTSIDGISDPSTDGYMATITNLTGSDITITNGATVGAGETAILTGTKEDLILKDEASISLVYKAGVGAVLVGGTGVNTGSDGDLEEASASFVDNQVTLADVTGLAFAAGTVRSFDVHVTVERNTLFETFRLQGVQLAGGFVMSYESTGDDSGVLFDVTSAGQVQYTSTSTGDAGTIKFRAETLTV